MLIKKDNMKLKISFFIIFGILSFLFFRLKENCLDLKMGGTYSWFTIFWKEIFLLLIFLYFWYLFTAIHLFLSTWIDCSCTKLSCLGTYFYQLCCRQCYIVRSPSKLLAWIFSKCLLLLIFVHFINTFTYKARSSILHVYLHVF